MSLRLASILILTTAMMLALNMAQRPHRVDSGAPPTCAEAASQRPITVQVPANQVATVSLADLAPAMLLCVGDVSCVAAVTQPHADGILRLARPAQGGNATSTGTAFTFVPKPGFTGVSGGWELVLYAGSTQDLQLAETCGSQALDSARLGIVRVNFEVRNTLPVATDDAIVVPAAAIRIDVGRETGVLANDLDGNGDPLVVYSAGTTTFPWGNVNVHHSGAYRVTITDRDHVAPAGVRYLVWDQQGSPTSVDTGYLRIDFEIG